MTAAITSTVPGSGAAGAPPALPTASAVRRRVVRRELHSPRSAAAIAVAVAIVVAAAWVGTEIVIALLGLPALLVAPADMFASLVTLPEAPAAIVVAAGAVVALVGVVLIVLALAPGRRARHVIDTPRAAAVVDNEVIASAIARRASLAADVDPDHTTVSVSKRIAVVDLVPTSGIPVDRDHVAEVVREQIASFGLRQTLTSRIRISENGKVGA